MSGPPRASYWGGGWDTHPVRTNRGPRSLPSCRGGRGGDSGTPPPLTRTCGETRSCGRSPGGGGGGGNPGWPWGRRGAFPGGGRPWGGGGREGRCRPPSAGPPGAAAVALKRHRDRPAAPLPCRDAGTPWCPRYGPEPYGDGMGGGAEPRDGHAGKSPRPAGTSPGAALSPCGALPWPYGDVGRPPPPPPPGASGTSPGGTTGPPPAPHSGSGEPGCGRGRPPLPHPRGGGVAPFDLLNSSPPPRPGPWCIWGGG